MASQVSHIQLWQQFLDKNKGIEFVLLQFMGYNANHFVQVIPVSRFTEKIKTNSLFEFRRRILHLLPHDHLAEGVSSGCFYLKPDLSTVHRQIGTLNRAVVIAEGVEPDTVAFVSYCPRTRLGDLDYWMEKSLGYFAQIAFDIQVVFMRRVKDLDDKFITYELINKAHSFQDMTVEDNEYLPMLEEITRSMIAVGIRVQAFHAQSAPGQWQFVLPCRRVVNAIDTLLKARAIISHIAEKHQLRATLCPKPSDMHVNGACVSITCDRSPSSSTALFNDKRKQERKLEYFFGGIMRHLPSILAFSLPQPESYVRVRTGLNNCGEWVAWGWENEEVPLCRITNDKFEFRLMDGLANPYLALCGILAAGRDGIERK